MFTAFAIAVCLPACEQRFSDENLKVVNREVEKSEALLKAGQKDSGVSPKEVESILGPPKRIETFKMPLETQKKELEGVRYFYEQDGEEFELHFIDGRLISKVRLIEERQAEKAKQLKHDDRSPEERAAEKHERHESEKKGEPKS